MVLYQLQVILVLVLLVGCHLRVSRQFGWQGQARTLTPIEAYRSYHVIRSTTSDEASSTTSSSSSRSSSNEEGCLEASRATLAAIVDRSWKKVASLIPHTCLVQSTDEVKTNMIPCTMCCMRICVYYVCVVSCIAVWNLSLYLLN